jgi:site-specific DNA-methyltransferase (adenine-specific)
VIAAEDARVVHGEALAELSRLVDDTVDAVVTDPPYSSGGMVRGDRAQPGEHRKYSGSSAARTLPGFDGDTRDQRGYAHWCALWLAQCHRVVRTGGAAVLFTDWRQLPTTTDALQAGGFVWRGIVPWWKPNSRPQSGRFAGSCEYVVWGSKGPMPVDHQVAPLPGFYQASTPRDRDHLAQKPLEVMRGLVRVAPPGGLVLDPFAGSGTTGVAALVEGRRFLGFESSAFWAAHAADRLARLPLAAAAGDQPALLADLAGEAT